MILQKLRLLIISIIVIFNNALSDTQAENLSLQSTNYTMRILAANRSEISQAAIGELLVLRLQVEPTSNYTGGSPRNCIAKTIASEGDNQYLVTDENGSATDPSVFEEWEFDDKTRLLEARFNAFKFPTSNTIMFQCSIRICLGQCSAVNCDGENALGRKGGQSTDVNQATTTCVLKEDVIVTSNEMRIN